jgi:FdrA protein
LPANARAAATLKAAADASLGRTASHATAPPVRTNRGKLVRGLFAGGTFCSEAQIVFAQAGLPVASNVPVPGAHALAGAHDSHIMVDLGDDEFTRGRPHPMIEPAIRERPIAAALADPAVGAILLDVVLGYGAHPDPAGHLAGFLSGRNGGALLIASVTGTDDDPQPRGAQVQRLTEVGVIVADSNAEAAEMAVMAVGGGGR